MKTNSQAMVNFLNAHDRLAKHEIDALHESVTQDAFKAIELQDDATLSDSERAYLVGYMADLKKQRRDYQDVLEFQRGRDNAILGSRMQSFFI